MIKTAKKTVQGINVSKEHGKIIFHNTFVDSSSSLSPHHSAGNFFRELKDVGSTGTACKEYGNGVVINENEKEVSL
jgi:hypothetical protein